MAPNIMVSALYRFRVSRDRALAFFAEVNNALNNNNKNNKKNLYVSYCYYYYLTTVSEGIYLP